MASLRISILDNFLSGGNVGNSFLSSPNATLNASTRRRSLVACAVLYLDVARRRRRRSSLLNWAVSWLTRDLQPRPEPCDVTEQSSGISVLMSRISFPLLSTSMLSLERLSSGVMSSRLIAGYFGFSWSSVNRISLQINNLRR